MFDHSRVDLYLADKMKIIICGCVSMRLRHHSKTMSNDFLTRVLVTFHTGKMMTRTKWEFTLDHSLHTIMSL